MNQKEFLDRCVEQGLTDGIRIRVYTTLDKNKNVVLSEDTMREEFDLRMREVKEIFD